jgi:methyl-accepting chemotaxis protein
MREKLKKFLSSLTSAAKSGADRFRRIESGRLSTNMIQKSKEIRLENPVKSVGMKLFLMFFISILFFVLVVGFSSYQLSKSVLKGKVAESSLQTITQAGQKLDFLSQTFEDVTNQIMADPAIPQSLYQLSAAGVGSYDYLVNMNGIMEKLSTYSHANKAIKAIYLYKATGELLTVAGSGSATVSPDTKASKDWLDKIVASDENVAWLDSKAKGYSASSSNTFAIGKLWKNTLSNGSAAVLVMEISTDVLANEVSQIQLGAESQIVITNAENKYIATKDAADIEKDANIQLSKEDLTKESGSFENANNHMVVYYKAKKSGWNLIGSMPVSSLVKDAGKIFNLTLIIALIAAIIAILIGMFVARMIGRPLVHLRNLMQQGAKGNLTVRANYQSKDEIGQLGNSFDLMMQQITSLVQQTSLSAQQVVETAVELTNVSKTTATAAREIAIATDEISNGAGGLANESERGNELTHHIGIQMKNVIQANLEMGTSAADVQSSSTQGTVYMGELINKTNLTEEMIRSMVEKVDKLKDSTRSIRKILELLNNITKQTNILSLNATIEAARAGAAGKGFMVVADEIRKLADQSRQSIDIVGQITETIQKEIDETTQVLSTAAPIFQEQIKSVKEADIIFKQVTSNMGGFIEQLSAVSDSISTLDQSQLILSDAMSNVSAVAEQSLATSQEVASLTSEQLSISDGLVKLSDKLQELSNSLNDTLSQFQVE